VQQQHRPFDQLSLVRKPAHVGASQFSYAYFLLIFVVHSATSMSAEEAGAVPPSDAVLFILVCFGIGIFIRLCLRWTKIPYTAMLLVSRAVPQQHLQL
jgi:hypothetical protein